MYLGLHTKFWLIACFRYSFYWLQTGTTRRAHLKRYVLVRVESYRTPCFGSLGKSAFLRQWSPTAHIITRSEYYGQRSVLQPGNREWATTIESISASGWALPPVIIFKGKLYNQAWFNGLPGDWRFEVSTNGRTTDEISLRWLQKLPLRFPCIFVRMQKL